MSNSVKDLAEQLLRRGYDDLPAREQRVLRRIAARAAISRDTSQPGEAGLSFGERLADRVAAFGGSWTFILIFSTLILIWVGLNVWAMVNPVDPYPFVFLNLILSMIAAVQAPVIMMSQNRQSSKDREVAAHDYEVNLKAELEIMSLHEKLDDLRMRQLDEHFASIATRLAAIEQTVRK